MDLQEVDLVGFFCLKLVGCASRPLGRLLGRPLVPVVRATRHGAWFWASEGFLL